MLTGVLKVLVSDEDGREVILSNLGAGELFGEMGVFDEQPALGHRDCGDPALRAGGDLQGRLPALPGRELRRRSLADHVQPGQAPALADRKIESLALMDVYGRVARLLMEMAEKDEDGQLAVLRKISKQDIAKMIGASREMVSRVMKDLHQQGLIEEGPTAASSCASASSCTLSGSV
jgi:CRP/FNR family cyclic AMP-dependent transcriptional regulator